MKVEIQQIGVEQAPLVQEIYESSPEYFRRTDHSEVLPHFALRDLKDEVPIERQSKTYRKYFCLILLDDHPIGIVDLHKDHPTPGTCYLGLLLLRGDLQSRGYGRLVFPAIENFISRELGCRAIKLGVSEANDVEGFWQKVGFTRNGHKYVWRAESIENNVFEMERSMTGRDRVH
jgi:GNAT superfamily N-acetyltransferase